jgi:formylmethanofuran dehydrogenase subunit E
MKWFFLMLSLNDILKLSASRHDHLCPRQVLGARIGLAGLRAFGFEPGRRNKRLLVIVETDGCFADGIEAATGCSVGHRTLRVEDYGKIAAAFVDCISGRAVRVSPALDIRQRAAAYEPGEKRHYFAQLAAYQVMPEAELLSIQEVSLSFPVEAWISRPGVRVNCALCGEEIINGREVTQGNLSLCQACARGAYYQAAPVQVPMAVFDLVSVTD